VVILGGGFGGLAVARGLARAKVRVTLVDSRNHHLFQPLLYQVATAGLSPADIAEPIRGVLRRQQNAEVILGRVTEIDRAAQLIRTEGTHPPIPYDYLVVATGVGNAYFGHPEWEEHAPGLKSVEEALEIRRRVLGAYEDAERDPERAQAEGWLTFVVVGGGPTGVELAGALAELARFTLAGNFRKIDPRSARVILCEGGERILNAFAPELSEKAKRMLEALGVEVRLGNYVSEITADHLTIGGEEIPTRNVLWAAGVAGTPLLQSLQAPLDRAGRVLVQPDLSVPADPRVFVIGDAAALQQDGEWIPGVAPAAIQGGQHVALMIQREIAGETTAPFRYFDKGSMATIGRSAAIAAVGSLKLHGTLAWLAWLVIHLMFLIGFRNRAMVLFQWAWAYFTYQRGARLVTGTLRPPPTRPEAPEAA